eukprot:1807796-Rhodomonas_salina.2
MQLEEAPATVSTVTTKTPGATLDDFNNFITKSGLGLNRSALQDNPAQVEDFAVAFYERNQDPSTSPNLQVILFLPICGYSARLLACFSDAFGVLDAGQNSLKRGMTTAFSWTAWTMRAS